MGRHEVLSQRGALKFLLEQVLASQSLVVRGVEF